MSDFVAALGIVLVLEGLIYGGFPGAAKKVASEVTNLPEGTLRLSGLAAMAIGVLIVWLIRG